MPTDIGNFQPGNVHTSQVLSELAVEFVYPELIGLRVAPIAPAAKQSDIYPVFYTDDQNILVPDSRGPGGRFTQVEWGSSQDTFFCNEHALENVVPWELQANADGWARRFLAQQNVAERLKHMVMLNHEAAVSTIFNASGSYASGYYLDCDTATNNFDDSGVNGLKVLQSYIRTLRLTCGGSPIKMVIAGDTWIEMQSDANFKPTLSDALLAAPDRLAAALRVDEIIIVDSQYNTADKGQTASRSPFWTSNGIWLIVAGRSGTDQIPTAVRTYSWNNPELGTSSGEAVRTGRDERYKQDWVQYSRYYDVKKTGVNAAGALTTAVYLKNVYDSI